jgi:hypothetical protein
MAVLVRTRRLSNPASRRRKRNYGTREGRSWSTFTQVYGTGHKGVKPMSSGSRKKKKKNPSRLSLKQKLHFGTARQRAAARLALRNPNKRSIKKSIKRYNKVTGRSYPFKQPTGRGKRKRVKNIGEIVSISLAGLNPGKRRKNTSMAKHRLKNTKAAKAARRRYRRARAGNPGRRRNYSHRHRNTTRKNPSIRRNRGRKRNPVYAMRRINRGRRRNPIMGITSGTIGKALGVIGGALASKYVTQLALGGNNTGMMGYGGNLVASIALGWGAGKLTKSQDFGVMVTVGGLAALVLRILSDNTSIGQYVNLSLAGVGKGGDTGLGIIQDSSFPVPQVAQPGSMTSFITPRATRNYVAGQVSAAAAQTSQMSAAGSGAGMGRMQGRMARRAIM